MKKFYKMSDDEKIAYLMNPIMRALQEAGGILTRKDIEKRIREENQDIDNYASVVTTSKSGNEYRKFAFKFNFAIKELSFMEYLSFVKRNPVITLTEKGLTLNLDCFDAMNDVVIPSKDIWANLTENNKGKKASSKEIEAVSKEIITEDIGVEVQYNNDFKDRLLTAISIMTPKKFEEFSRCLLEKMGISFTEEGKKMSHDGGIDGCGYFRDSGDFRTSKVVIQCKRYNKGPVGPKEIQAFNGAINTSHASYGVFITNSTFTKDAKKVALEGNPIVTLIDGEQLVELVKRYSVGVKPITVYELQELYDEEHELK